MQCSKQKEWLLWLPAKCPVCCCRTGKLSTSSNCRKWHRQRQRRPSSSPDSVSCILRSSPSQTEECINCFAEFLSVFMDNFPCGPTFPSPLLPLFSIFCLPHLKASLQRRLSTKFSGWWRERFAWWGELGHSSCILPRQADALCTRDALPSISLTNQCNLCLAFSIAVTLAREKVTVKRKCIRTCSILLPWNNNGTCTAKHPHSLNKVWQLYIESSNIEIRLNTLLLVCCLRSAANRHVLFNNY